MNGLVRLECVKCKCVFETLNPPMDFVEYALCPQCQQHLGDDDEDDDYSRSISRAD